MRHTFVDSKGYCFQFSVGALERNW